MLQPEPKCDTNDECENGAHCVGQQCIVGFQKKIINEK